MLKMRTELSDGTIRIRAYEPGIELAVLEAARSPSMTFTDATCSRVDRRSQWSVCLRNTAQPPPLRFAAYMARSAQVSNESKSSAQGT